MRARLGTIAAALLWSALVPSPAVGTHAGDPLCQPAASKPWRKAVNDVDHVWVTHQISCTAKVDGIYIEGRLKRDGKVVASEARGCTGPLYGCQLFTHQWNPSGLQVWRGVTEGFYLWRGVRHDLELVRGPKASY